MRPGLVLGHEPVGVIEALGDGLEPEYQIGQRVIVGAITPCGQCFYCLNGVHSQCGGPLGGWRFGNTIDGAWADYLLVPDARANLAHIPDGLTDEQVVLVPDIFSTGLSGAESGNVKVGDAVAVFAQGPIGLCATLGAKLRGAASHHRCRFGARAPRDGQALRGQRRRQPPRAGSGRRNPATDRRTGRRRGHRGAREAGDLRECPARDRGLVARCRAWACIRASSSRPTRPSTRASAINASSRRSVPGGKERMRRLMEMVVQGRVDLSPLITHRFALEEIHDAFEVFSQQRAGVLKVAISPAPPVDRRRVEAAEEATVVA